MLRYIIIFCIVLFSGYSSIAQLAMPDSVCAGATKHYYVDINPVFGSTYEWSIDGIIQNSSLTNEIDITWNTTGAYLLNVQEISLFGCKGEVRSGQVIVTSSPIAYITNNSPVCEGSPIILSAQTVLGGTYLWTSEKGYLSTEQSPVIISASLLDAGIYSLVVSANGCSSILSTVIIVVDICNDFHIPEGFSPNSDGINDFFIIRGIESFPANTFITFNRWGNKVYEASPYLNNWNGKATMGLIVGEDILPVGTYFYVLDLGDGSNIYKGTIYLNK